MKNNLYSLQKFILAILFSLASVIGWGQLFQQQFTTNLASFSNSNSSNATYINATPSNAQLTYLGSSGTGAVISVASNKLTIARTGNGWGFARGFAFSGPPSSLMVQFDYSTTGATAATTSALVFAVGGGTSNGAATTSLTNSDVHTRLAFNCTATSGQFVVRDMAGSVNGATTYTGTQTILFVLNNSGATLTYKAPNGSYETVANDKSDIWVGTSKQLDEVSATTATQTLSYFKCISTAGNQTVNFGNMLMDPIPAVPISNAATNVAATSFTANWTSVSGVTGYRVDVATDAAFTSMVPGYDNLYVSGQATNSLNVTGLNSNTTYYYRVRGASQYTVGEFAGGNSATQNLTTPVAYTITWCNASPSSTTIDEGGAVDIFAQVYAAGLTDAGGQGAGMTAEIGYKNSNTDPSAGGWTWTNATYVGDVGNNDNYKISLGAGLTPGTYYYASRFKLASGTYIYGGTGGVWSSTANNGVLTVNSNLVDWCNVQFPTSGTISEGDAFNVYAQAYEPTVTDTGSPGAGITAWIGYSTSNTNPNSGGWTWVATSFNGDKGNNDEYFANIASGLTPGTYYYASRFQKAGSTEYQYGGTGGVWSSNSGVLTVNPNVVDWANVQYPLSGTITAGDNFNVYAQVYEPTVTDTGSPGAGITAWIGYSTSNTNPNSGGWTWVATSFNGDKGNNDEYFANIGASLTPGTYYYASRFIKSGSSTYIYGGTGGLWNSDNGILTVNAAFPVVSSASPTGTVGVAFSYNISATNTPTSYAIYSGTLPAGLSLNTTTGEISGTPTTAGSVSVEVTASNTGGTSAQATLSFTIAKANQTITFGALTAVTYGVAPYSLIGTASSTLPVSYASSNTAVATVSGNTITIVGAGTTTITASQVGNANYNAAADVPQTLTVNPKGLSISGVTANNKVEDGNTTATLSGTPSLVGVEAIDVANVSISGTPTATFASSSAGTGIAVTVTGYTLSGSAAGNYTLSQPTGLTADITGLGTPVATDATNVLETSFDANWNAVAGANGGYLLEVSAYPNFESTIISENFAGFTTNNGSTDRGATLNTYLQTPGWTGTAVYEMVGYAKIGAASTRGIITTPTINLSANGGVSTLSFDLGKFGTDVGLVQVFHAADGVTFVQVGSDITPPASLTTQTIQITGGTVNSKIRIQAKNASNNRFYLDNFAVKTVNLLPGYNPKAVAGQSTTTTSVSGLSSCTSYYYRVRAVNGTVKSANSNIITVNPISIGGTTTGNQTICYSTQPSNITLSGSCGTIVKWQHSSDAAFTSPVDIAETTSTLSGATIGNLTETTYFRAVVKSFTNPEAYSSYVTVTVKPLASITTQPMPQTVCEGNSVSFTVAATGSASYSYEWKKDGVTIGAPDSDTYTIPAATLADAGTYSVDILDDCLNIISSNTASLTVTPTAVAGTITGATKILINTTSLYSVSGNSAGGTWGITNAGGANASIDASGNVTAGSTLGTATVTYTVDTGCGVPVTANYAITITDATTWDGTSWDLGNPDADINAIIDGNYSGASFDAKTLTINSGKSLDILGGTKVTVTDGITNNGTFTMQNDGNLIQINNAANTGNIKINRSTQDNLTRLDYVYWSSPVLGQGLKAFSPKTVLSRFYTYNEQTDGFVSVPNINTATFTPGVGYVIRVPNDYTAATNQQFNGVFTGVPNNGNYTYAATKLGGGYNLVGNPYPSNLELDGVNGFYNINSGVINNKFYFWTNYYANPTSLGSGYSGINYAIWNASGSVTPGVPDAVGTVTPTSAVKVGQGFIVEAHTAGSLVFNNAMRTSAASTFVSKQTNTIDRYWISMVTPANNYYNQLIAYLDGATNELDANYDAEKLETPSDDFYSILDTNKLTIQGRAYPLLMSDVVTLGNKYAENGTYKITLSKKEGIFADGQSIYLHDKISGTYTDLQQGDYSFAANQGEQTDRFEITYKPGGTLGTDNGVVKTMVVYNKDQSFVIEAPEKLIEVKLIDASGRLISTLTPNKNKVEINNSTLSNGVYVLQIKTASGITVKKVIK